LKKIITAGRQLRVI